MLKLTGFVAILCLSLVNAHRPLLRQPGNGASPFKQTVGSGFPVQKPDRSNSQLGQSHGSGPHLFPGVGHRLWLTELCSNGSLTEAFLTQTRELITELRENGSFADALAKRTQSIDYIQSDENAELLSSNCTQYFAGLFAAVKSDIQSQDQPAPNQFIVSQRFREIFCDLTNICPRRKPNSNK
ncbi:unnamed protein product [Rotaria sp. Silwood2]|nr:unnamed protein product [Rotaria sp. Silwood2]CAF2639674.1 unnamed protein product [Rotaria sp. Silwood2]CAF3075759.1 unnamed protein product [Rotaria sp. Silwood2]CAF3914665.1 unnamed protein product [Rotaria sp. Silwood2]CAF4039330.1 unnamed protein product [Rotaria sp. Silwood2]